LGRWVRAEQPQPAVSGVKAQAMNLADHNELVRLRKENEQLRMEREIIKKAAVFFAKELG
jgi:transposase